MAVALLEKRQAERIADLKPGVRVVAEVSEKSKDNVAQSVKIGAAAVTSQAPHK